MAEFDDECVECKKEQTVINTEFIYQDNTLYKESKVISITPSYLTINNDTIRYMGKDSLLLGYRVITYPNKRFVMCTLKIEENRVQVDNVTFCKDLLGITPSTPRKSKKHEIKAGETRNVLKAMGIPEQSIPKIPKIGQIIYY